MRAIEILNILVAIVAFGSAGFMAYKFFFTSDDLMSLKEFRGLHPEIKAIYRATVVAKLAPAMHKVVNDEWEAVPDSERAAFKALVATLSDQMAGSLSTDHAKKAAMLALAPMLTMAPQIIRPTTMPTRKPTRMPKRGPLGVTSPPS